MSLHRVEQALRAALVAQRAERVHLAEAEPPCQQGAGRGVAEGSGLRSAANAREVVCHVKQEGDLFAVEGERGGPLNRRSACSA